MRKINEFPFTCEFFRLIKDPDDFYGESIKQTEYKGSCDIQITGEGMGNLVEKSTYTIFIPIIPPMRTDAKGNRYMSIDKGLDFEGNQFGRKIVGRVADIAISQLGKTAIFIESVGT